MGAMNRAAMTFLLNSEGTQSVSPASDSATGLHSPNQVFIATDVSS